MKLDERFKQLKELPEDEQLKIQIRNHIENNQQKTKSSFNWNGWKEVSIVIGICFIGLFLLYTSSNGLKNHAATEEITGLYSYHNHTGEGFRGKASTLFIGVKDIMTERTVLLFETIDELPILDQAPYGFVDHYDIVVVKKGVKHQYQLSEDYLYDVDNNLIYPGYKEFPMALADDLTKPHENNGYPLALLIPFSVIFINMMINIYYKRRRMNRPEKLPGTGIAVTISIFVLIAIGLYVYFIGPIYRPLLFLFAILYGWLLWWPVKRNITDLNILKVERIKTLFIVSLVFFWIMMY